MKNDFNEEFQIDISEKISLEMLTYFFPIEIIHHLDNFIASVVVFAHGVLLIR